MTNTIITAMSGVLLGSAAVALSGFGSTTFSCIVTIVGSITIIVVNLSE
jgi:hypothetical protein